MYILFIILSSFYSLSSYANDKGNRELLISKTENKIIVDGNLDEQAWQLSKVAKDFYQHYPYDSSLSETKTEVMVTYDDQFVYIGAVCYDDLPGDFVVQSLKRDFNFEENDAFGVTLDAYGDNKGGFSFVVSPLEVQRDGLITNGGSWGGGGTEWDGKWYSKVKIQDKQWIVEMAIPFKTLRYNKGVGKWNINFIRNDLKRNEKSSWSPIPRQHGIYFLSFNGKLTWDEAPKKPGTNVSVIPYFTGSINKNYEYNNEIALKPNAGLDAKVAITSSLNLDLTFNPDFSQVDVDKQVINLTRFSLFVPEKRNFFLENSDLFGSIGFRQIRPFFSRRIGLYAINDWMYEPVPIIAGARLSGNINKNWRIGMLNSQTAGVNNKNITSQNYSVMAIQRKTIGNSFLSMIMVNRQAFPFDTILNGDSRKKYFLDKKDFNRVIGGEYLYIRTDSKVIGKMFYMHSLSPGNSKDNYTHGTWLMYNSNKLWAMWNHEYVGRNFLADAGFVPHLYNYDGSIDSTLRLSYWRMEPMANLKFYPGSGVINTHGPGFYVSYYFDKNLKPTDLINQLYYELKFQNLSEIKVMLYHNYTYLSYLTDITGRMDTLLPSGEYVYKNTEIRYESSKRNKLFGEITAGYGEFYNGSKMSFKGELSFRTQPWGVFAINFSHDEVKLPEPYKGGSLTLLGPRIELSFAKNLFLTTFVQYNNQINNINVNGRIQWRFRPMSDLFIVYSDNYLSDDFKIKNRALVVKFVYWITA